MARKVMIGDRMVGAGEPCFIIAEIGSNHDGKLDQAKALIQAAAKAGADAVKFQSFSAEGLTNKKTLRDGRWVEDPSWGALRALELPEAWHPILSDCAREAGILFLSTPFDFRKADLLQQVGVPAFKVASSDLTFHPFLSHVAQFGKPIILSTGMAYLGEVDEAIRTIQACGNGQILLLHCVSTYPARLEDANLRAIATLRKAFGLPVGCSDHSLGTVVPLGGVALGGCALEKHITLSRTLPGPDHSFALEVEEFARMVEEIRGLERALGDGLKRPVEREHPSRRAAYRGIFAACDISPGELIRQEMVKMVRPPEGIEARFIDLVIGRRAARAIREDEPIAWDSLG